MALNVGNLSEVELLPFVAPLWLLSRIGSRVKISHYIQPSNLSSALRFRKSLLPETTMSNDAKTPNGLSLGIGCQLKKRSSSHCVLHLS